jgi:hypothetical protein
VDIPKGAYKGQKLTRLVRTKTAASTSNTIPRVPVMIPEKYRYAITAAMITLMILSALPIFFFIT